MVDVSPPCVFITWRIEINIIKDIDKGQIRTIIKDTCGDITLRTG
jgi:hypothetical protein